MIGSEIEQVVADELDAFLSRVVAGLFVAYDAADREAKKEHDRIEAKNVIGILRRSKVETNMREAAKLSGLIGNVVKADHSAWTYTEVRSATTIITASSVTSPGAMVHDAKFRDTLAETGQGVLFGEPEPTTDVLYGIVTHTASKWLNHDDRQKWGHLPGSVHLAFPQPELKRWVWQIDLFKRYTAIVKAHTPSEWTDLQLHAYIERGRRAA